MDLEISTRESGDVTILDLRGRSIEASESELLRSNLQKLVANGVHKVLLNLTELTQVDSSAVTFIVRTYLKLLRPSGHVLEVLGVLHLLKLIPSFEDETQALASFLPLSYSAKP